ncbi:hypothetical protein ACIBEJ_48540 [Nonomuraea sp. NPDC050790]|uniref:hypothetical protein n=1 Tax=Nonomuraea sp. NPDC050790 TaxID=3364371 RepID=UPI0037BCAE98
MTARIYPLPKAEDDSRFTIGLLADLVAVLEQAGYPKLGGHDLVDLRQAVYGFLYGPRTP